MIKLCTPAIVYLVSSILVFMLVADMFSMYMFFMKGLFVLLWTWFLNFLCNKGYETVSWILVIIPWVMFFFTVISLVGEVDRQIQPSTKPTGMPSIAPGQGIPTMPPHK